jgi:hypothetical protein
MQNLFVVAGLLALITGIVHSVLGEVLIFRHVRSGGFVPAMDAPPLRERNIRILWATWHLASVFGWAFAIVLIGIGLAPLNDSIEPLVLSAIAFANLAGSLLVLIGTKGRHPGWIALLLVAALTWTAATTRSHLAIPAAAADPALHQLSRDVAPVGQLLRQILHERHQVGIAHEIGHPQLHQPGLARAQHLARTA